MIVTTLLIKWMDELSFNDSIALWRILYPLNNCCPSFFSLCYFRSHTKARIYLIFVLLVCQLGVPPLNLSLNLLEGSSCL